MPAGDPPTDAFLAKVLAAIGSETTAEKAKSAVKKLDKQVGGVWHRLVERMVAAGTLGEDKHGRLIPTRHPVLDRPGQDSVLGGTSGAGGSLPAPRAGRPRSLRPPSRQNPDQGGHRQGAVRPEVKQVIDELIAAVAVAAVVASTAGGNG